MSLTRIALSGSTNGAPLSIAATSDPGTTIHTATSSTTATTWDELWVWAYNTDTQAHVVVFEIAGNGATNLMTQTIPAQSGMVLVIPGLQLQNSLTLKAYDSTSGSKVAVVGYVNTIA